VGKKNRSDREAADYISKKAVDNEGAIRRRNVSFIASTSLVVIFAISYGYLEYYYINDPVQGKTENLTVKGGDHRVATPLVGGLYSYHIFPMMILFFLISFTPFFDSISFNILGRHKRRKTFSLGISGVISAILVEDVAWFFYRWWLPLDDDPKKGLLMQASDWTTRTLGGLTVPSLGNFHGFMIPYWYLIAIGLAGLFYYYSFRKPHFK
jgi:hypothetical protein